MGCVEVGGGERRVGVKAASFWPELGRTRALLGRSLYRTWELPALLGGWGSAKKKGGLLPGEWREMRIRFRTGPMSYWIVPVSAARRGLGAGYPLLCSPGDWGSGSRAFW